MSSAIVLISLFTIVIVIVVIFLTVRYLYPNKTEDVRLGGSCGTNSKCAVGLVCDRGKCNVPVGGFCSNDSECESDATSCHKGICVVSKGKLNEVCSDRHGCKSGLSCVDGVCKSEPGGVCRRLSDCTSESTDCLRSKCVVNNVQVNQRCDSVYQCESGLTCFSGICRADVGTSCNTDSDCLDGAICDRVCYILPRTGDACTSTSQLCAPGLTCTSSSVLVDGVLTYTGFNSPIVDVSSAPTSGNQTLLLFEDGNMAIDDGNSISSIRSSIKMKNIGVILGEVYGLSYNGVLFRRSDDNSTDYKWNWDKVGWSENNNINNVSFTQDGKYIWIQTNSYEGSLLYFTHKRLHPVVIDQSSSTNLRIYGRSKSSYLEIDQTASTGTIHPSETRISNIYSGALLSSGDVFKITPADRLKYRTARTVNGKLHLLTNPLCGV